MKSVSYTRAALRALRGMTPDVRARIVSKIDQYARDPGSLAANVKRLQGRNGFRLRVGDWRVIFDEDAQVVAVLNIGSRGDIYSGGG